MTDIIEKMRNAMIPRSHKDEVPPMKAVLKTVLDDMREWNDKHQEGMGTEMVIRTFLDAYEKDRMG